MSTDTEKLPVEDVTTDDSDDDSFAHRFCQCNELSALCGKTKADWEVVENPDPAKTCVVCWQLHLARHCPKCAAKS